MSVHRLLSLCDKVSVHKCLHVPLLHLCLDAIDKLAYCEGVPVCVLIFSARQLECVCVIEVFGFHTKFLHEFGYRLHPLSDSLILKCLYEPLVLNQKLVCHSLMVAIYYLRLPCHVPGLVPSCAYHLRRRTFLRLVLCCLRQWLCVGICEPRMSCDLVHKNLLPHLSLECPLVYLCLPSLSALVCQSPDDLGKIFKLIYCVLGKRLVHVSAKLIVCKPGNHGVVGESCSLISSNSSLVHHLPECRYSNLLSVYSHIGVLISCRLVEKCLDCKYLLCLLPVDCLGRLLLYVCGKPYLVVVQLLCCLSLLLLLPEFGKLVPVSLSFLDYCLESCLLVEVVHILL